jgi:hypothetical protein
MLVASTPYFYLLLPFRRLPELTAAVFALLLSLVGGCSTMSVKGDQMCAEIARFANGSADDHSIHSIELLTDWGGVFSDDKNTIAEKSCKHDAYAPGERLCNYLMENTSTEFASINFRRALSCLGDEVYAGPPQSRVEYMNGKVSSYSAKGVQPHVQVFIEFSSGSNERAPSLTISAASIPP